MNRLCLFALRCEDGTLACMTSIDLGDPASCHTKTLTFPTAEDAVAYRDSAPAGTVLSAARVQPLLCEVLPVGR